MLSTLMNFRLYSGDMTKTLARIGAEASVQREAQYYQENIGKVRTVDDLMGDFRLYSYALKAHGLSEQINSPAFVRKILESDLSDSSSFASRLSDPRYRAFAAAFDFAAARAEPVSQSQAQTDRLVEAYSEHLVRGGAIAAQKMEGYEAAIARVQSVDELLADPQLFEMVTKIAGLDPAFTSKSYMRAVLMKEPLGPQNSTGLQFLAQNFDFAADGSRKPGQGIQTARQTAEFATRYFSAVGQSASPQAAAFEARYFEAAALSARRVEDLVDDPTTFRVLRIAAGLPEGDASKAALVNLLSLPASDPNNPIARLTGDAPATVAQREAMTSIKAAFDFENGATTGPATDADRVSRLLTVFHDAYPKADTAQLTLQTNSFRVRIAEVETISDLFARDFLGRRTTLDYVLKAFDIDPATQSLSTLRQVLTSDPSDPDSFVRRLKDERYEKLAAAFNFGSDGKVQAERQAQSVRWQQQTASLYAASFGTEQTEFQKASVRKETVAYLSAVNGLSSIEGLLRDEKTLAFALKAHGLDDETLSAADLRKLLTSDLSYPASFARSFGDKRYTDFAGSFQFETDGTIRPAGGGIQDEASLLSTQNLYLLQMLEEQAGATSEGTRLALYFLRKSPDIKNAFSILADKAIFAVVRTSLGLPEQMSQLDIDRQAAILESRLDFSDFKDPKALDKFISRFSTLYDMNNAPAGGSDPILALFGGGSASGGIVGLF